jgi:hypothetical protein
MLRLALHPVIAAEPGYWLWVTGLAPRRPGRRRLRVGREALASRSGLLEAGEPRVRAQGAGMPMP